MQMQTFNQSLHVYTFNSDDLKEIVLLRPNLKCGKTNERNSVEDCPRAAVDSLVAQRNCIALFTLRCKFS